MLNKKIIKKTFTLISFILLTIPSTININLAVDSSQFTDVNFKKLIDEVDTRIINDPHIIPPLIRLIFHDCIAGCNGCINVENPDNKRLKGVLISNIVSYFDSGYLSQQFYGKSISMADYWVIAAMRAIYIASNSSGLTQPVLDFKYGRINCKNGAKLDDMEDLPGASKNFDHVKEVFGANKFNMTVKEMVAIMGAHNLGLVKADSSGYNGWWTVRNLIFDNSYYKQLVDKTMKYVPSTLNTPEFGTKYQWNATVDNCVGSNCRPRPAKHPRMMLNVDMSLYLKFQVGNDGKPSCNYETCSKNDESFMYVEEFARSEVEFKKAFGSAFVKMVEHGYEGKCILKDLITDKC